MADTLLALQLAIGLVFLFSAIGKLLTPLKFAAGVTEYHILPEWLAFVVGIVLIPFELFLAASHISGWLLPFALPAGLVMLISFMIAVGINLKRGSVLPCHCFGAGEGEMISARTLVRLGLLFTGEAIVLAGSGWPAIVELTYPDRVSSFAELGRVFFWATFILILAVWLLSLTDVVALLRDSPLFKGRRPKAEGTP